MHASSRLTFSSALDESRSRRLLRRHRMHLPLPSRKSHRSLSQIETASDAANHPDSSPAVAVTMTPSAPLDPVSLTSEPE